MISLVLQTSLYEFLDLNEDPIFNLIQSLREGDEIQVESFSVRKTDKFYEIENDELHEGFKTINQCYSFISSNL